ncbi:penicillin acylase family protein, partial [Pseudoalteromonas ruthenica]
MRDKIGDDMQQCQWGKLNELPLNQPFSKHKPFLRSWLDMQITPGFGVSFMPEVQRPEFGASPRCLAHTRRMRPALVSIRGG